MPIVDPSLLNSQVFFDEAPCGLIVTQEDGTIFRANLAFAAWIGFSELELCGRRFQELLTMGGRMFHQTALGTADENAGVCCRGEARPCSP